MEVRVVGAHQAESRDQHNTSFVIDRALAIDAGSLASGLSLDEQLAITTILLTHRHWDHVKDLPGFGFNRYARLQAGQDLRPVDVWCVDDVRDAVRDLLFSNRIWLDFFSSPDPDHPILRHQPVPVGTAFSVGEYVVEAIPVNHSVPSHGYQVSDHAGRRFYYTSDNGPGCGAHWANASPDLLATECTFSDAQAARSGGEMHGHLCPSQVRVELETFRTRRGYLPRVLIVHVNPLFESEIRGELAGVAHGLGASIQVAREGDRIQV